MHLLVLGGSMDHLGGVEAFCERSMEALGKTVDWRMHRIPTSTAYLTIRKLPRLLSGLAALIKYRAQRPDLVWLQYVNLPDLCYLAVAKMLGMRVMVTPHLGANWRSQSNGWLRAISGWLLARADRFALISRTQEAEINLPPDVPRSMVRNFLPAHVLGAHQVDETQRPPLLQLIHSGRLSEGKGTFLFVEVCARLKRAGAPFEARITGGADDATLARLHGAIVELEVADEVKVLGRVPEEELLRLLRSSDVLVHLSRIDSYPLIVLEAMTCGTIPVCMELAGARDMIETYDGHVVAANSAAEEAAAYLATRNLIDIRSRGSAVAARVRADYAWEHCATLVKAALTATIRPPH